MSLTERQIDIARHALGLTRGKKSYRNHFVTGPATTDWADLMAMVEGGYAICREGGELTGGSYLFTITPTGKALAVRKGESV